jgi:hypothetical protein
LLLLLLLLLLLSSFHKLDLCQMICLSSSRENLNQSVHTHYLSSIRNPLWLCCCSFHLQHNSTSTSITSPLLNPPPPPPLPPFLFSSQLNYLPFGS